MSGRQRPEWVQAEYERIGREREAASRETDRLYLWEKVRVLGSMLGWSLLGAVVAGFGFHVDDRDTGMLYIYGGLVITTGGVFWTIVRAYRRGEDRGDW